MTREEAIKILEYPVKKWSMEWDEREDGLSYYEALDMAISAIRQQEHFREVTKKVEPLTMDELRQMDGEPVYCVEITGREEWLFRRDGGFADMYGEFTSDDFMSWDNYGKLWWCYRQKPEEDDHDERKENENARR